MKLADARLLAQPTPKDREVAAEVQENGGSLTAEELAWTASGTTVGARGPDREPDAGLLRRKRRQASLTSGRRMAVCIGCAVARD